MEIAQLPRKKRKDLITLLILFLGLPLILYAAYQVVQLISNAGAEAVPKNVVISNLTTSSVTVSWLTDIESRGSVIPVDNGAEKSPVIDKRGNTKRLTHYVELTGLEPNSSYDFIIVSDSKKYSDSGGKSLTFKTAPITADTPTPNPIHGSVDGNDGDDVVLYALLKDKSTYPVSAVIPSGGNWIMDLASLRKIADKSMATASSSSNIVLIAVGGVEDGAVVDGVYSDIFDSSGKLKDTNPLSMSSRADMYSFIPEGAMLNAYAIAEEEEEEEEEETPAPPPQEEEEEEEEEEPVDEEEEFNRQYKIVQQLQWINMVTGDGSIVSSTAGEQSIQIVNLTDTGFTVLWVSETKEEGTVKYGTSKDSLTNLVADQRDGLTNKGEYYLHSVDITRLQPDTEYYFEVVSGSATYDNDGSKYSIKTFSTLSSPPPFESVTGNVGNMPEHGEVIVVAYIKDGDETGSSGNSLKISTLVDDNGKWILSIADSRTQDGSAYYEYTAEDSLEIDLLTTFDTDTHTESMDGVSSRDVDIELSDSSTVGAGYTEVVLLENYGILGASSGTPLSSDSDDSSDEYSVDTGTQTPQTGLLDNLIYLSIFSLGLIGSGCIIYVSTRTKSKRNNKMIKDI